jgi:hypothetical protein
MIPAILFSIAAIAFIVAFSIGPKHVKDPNRRRI